MTDFSNSHLRPAATRRTALLLAAVVLAGCAHQAPTSDPIAGTFSVPAVWSEGDPSQFTPATSLATWWQRFGDAQLSTLIDDALRNSPTVQSAIAALRQSRALVDVAAAGLSPTVKGSSSAQRTRTYSQGGSSSFGLGVDASWEPDLFGGLKAGVDAAKADARASEMSLANVQVSLAAEVALAYIDLRNQQARVSIAQNNLMSQDDTLQIARWRNQAGLVSSLDVEQASATAEQTRAQVPLLRAAQQQTQHRLAVLTGRAPGDLADLGVAPVPLPPDDLIMAFPADTLRQRPDVRQAEAQVRAALARVAVADAARYPSLTLSGSLGLQALTLGSLLRSSSALGSLMAGLTLPIFDGGAIAGRLESQQAAFEQTRAAYVSSVLTALQDVEDALSALKGDRERAVSLNAAAIAARNANLLATQQYQAGLIDFNTALQSQRTLLSAQDAQASVIASLAADHVQLYKALGGGWSPDAAAPSSSQPTAAR
ncbi:efflux transporter outer membrane subunit [Ottowia thiooxydans]|uniref:efflux transporter outer membrane subunit n=1 Tax=Ottowia thiooxydans TaxID=219182 RepID=UPI0003FC126F|nr:efflux transporter outer membrane subunit [Ottowia thiooxydans]